jgi:hypothetical protein
MSTWMEGPMTERPRFFDDLAGVAGGAMSALAGLREEAESVIRARVDEAIRKLDLVRREDLEAVQEMAANARAGQQALEARLAALEARISQSASPGASSATAVTDTMDTPPPAQRPEEPGPGDPT